MPGELIITSNGLTVGSVTFGTFPLLPLLYNSTSTSFGLRIPGWSTTFGGYVVIFEDTTDIVYDESGQVLSFSVTLTGALTLYKLVSINGDQGLEPYASGTMPVSSFSGDSGTVIPGPGGFTQLSLTSGQLASFVAALDRVVFNGSAADDVFEATSLPHAVELNGGAGNDALYGAVDLANVINGDAGDDNLFGQGDGDVLDGGADNDFVTDADGFNSSVAGPNPYNADTLRGGSGNDTITSYGGSDLLEGGDGNDVMASNASSVVGAAGNATLNGGDGDDNLVNYAGNATLDGGAGSDRLAGTGSETVVFTGLRSGYTFTTGSSVSGYEYTITGPDGTDVIDDSIELFRFDNGTFTLAQMMSQNAPPSTTNVKIATNTGTAIAGRLGATDTDAGDVPSFAVVTGPAHGTLSLGANGSYTYTPNAGFAGSDVFTFSVSDGTNPASLAEAVISVASPITQVTPIDPSVDAVVNETLRGSISNPEAASLADGGHLVVWSMSPQNSTLPDANSGVYAQRYDAAGNKVGGEFLVNTTTEGYNYAPSAVGLSNGGFIVAWSTQESGGFNTEVYAQLYAADGSKVGSEFLVNQNTSGYEQGPVVAALAGGKFAVTWTTSVPDNSDTDVILRIFNADGSPGTDDLTVNQTTAGYQTSFGPGAMTTLADGRFVVAWENYGTGPYASYIRVWNADGSPASDEILISSNTAGYFPQATVSALAGGGFVTAWLDGAGGVIAQRFDTNGNKVGAEALVIRLGNTQPGESEVQGLSDGGFVIVWSAYQYGATDTNIVGQRFDATGALVGGQFILNTDNPNLVLDLRFPSIELRDDGALVAVWSNYQIGKIEQKIVTDFTTQVTPIDPSVDAVVNETLQGSVSSPEATSLADGGHLVVWSMSPQNSTLPDANPGVYAQRYDASGNKVGGEFLVNTTTEWYDYAPSAAGLSNGGFIVAWSTQEASASVVDVEVYAQLYAADGSKVGSEFLVNQNTSGYEQGPVVAALSDGKFVVAWTSNVPNANESEVIARIFNADGSAATDEFTINQTTAGGQFSLGPGTVTTLVDGRFVVAWESYGTGSYSSYIRVLNADGSPVGDELLISSNTNGSFSQATVSALTGGGFVTAWIDSAGGIIAQRFDANGSKVGSETTVSRLGNTLPGEPEVQGLSDGGFVILWSAHQYGSTDTNIVGQRFDATGALVGGQFIVNTDNPNLVLDLRSPSIELRDDGALVAVWSNYQIGKIEQKIVTDFTGGAPKVLIGGPGNDSFIGSALGDQLLGADGADRLIGIAGNDTIDGGANTDTAVYSGNRNDYAITVVNGTITIIDNRSGSPDDTDTVTGVEVFEFANAVVTLDELSNTAPIVSGSVALAASNEDAARTITAAELLANASDANGDALQVLSLAASSGTLTDNGDGTWNFQPAANDDTSVTFSYQVSDGVNAPVAASATFDLLPRNDNPIANNFTVDTTEDIAVTFDARSFATDVDGDTLAVTAVTAQSGTAVINADGTITYTPVANVNGSDALTYTVSDGRGGTATASIEVGITAVNDAPTGAPTATLAAGAEDVAYTVSAASLLAGFADVDGDTLSVAQLEASIGSVANNGNGTFTITQPPNVNGPITLTFSVTDGNGGTLAGQTLSYTINPVNDAATIAGTATGTVTEDGTLTAAGALTVADADTGESAFRTPASLAGTFGTFMFDAATGAWGYALNNSAANVQALTAADTRTDTLTVTSLDGTATQAITVTVRGADDGIVGQPGQTTVNGTSGNDQITLLPDNVITNAGAGNDTIVLTPSTGFQAHVIQGGAGNDTIDLSAATGAININLGSSLATGGGLGVSVLTSIENATGGAGGDTITGSGGANRLDGRGGNDTISGGGGADTIIGGSGDDWLTGSGGNDVFVFAGSFGTDRIADFDANPGNAGGPGQDLLDISAYGLSATSFGTGVRVSYAGGNATVTIDPDGLGGNPALGAITLAGVTGAGANSISVDDFRFF